MDIVDLTDRQMKFVDEYMKCGDKKQALLNSGYEGKGKHSTVTSIASRMYKHPAVQAEIERRRVELKGMNIIDAKDVITRLTKMFNGELTSEFITKKGEVLDIPISFRNQIEAAKLLVAILGLESEKKVEVKHDIQVTDKLSSRLSEASQTFLAKRVEPQQALPETTYEVVDDEE